MFEQLKLATGGLDWIPCLNKERLTKIFWAKRGHWAEYEQAFDGTTNIKLCVDGVVAYDLTINRFMTGKIIEMVTSLIEEFIK